MDIVYLVKNCQTNEEFTYSLRSLVNIPHDKVFIVGGCPENLDKTKIIHVPIPQTGTKFQNTTKNLETICLDKRLSEDFILMNDDFFILLPTERPSVELNLCRGFIKDVYDDYLARNGAEMNSYAIGMRQTMIFLQDLGIDKPLSYELHIPIVMAKNGVLRAFSMPHIRNIHPGHIRSIYGNLFLKGSKVIKDVKVRHKTDHIPENGQFLSSADNTWEYVKPIIKGKFPQKSEYEL